MTAQAKIVGVRELRGKLSEYLRRVAMGESFDVVVRGEKVAELRAPTVEREGWPSADPNSPNFRLPGALKGQIWTAENWDTWDPEDEAAWDSPIFPEPR